MNISCCYSLPTVLPHRRALATTAVRSLQQQWLLPENDVSTTASPLGQKTTRLSSCPPCSLFHHRRIPMMAVQHLSLPCQRWLSPTPHRTPPCAVLLVSAGLQKDWLHEHGPSPPSLPVRFSIFGLPALLFLQFFREHGPVAILLTLRSPMRLARIGSLWSVR